MLLSGVKGAAPQTRLTRAVSQLPVLRAFVPFLLSFSALRWCLGDHGTAQCTYNKDTDGPACVPVNRRAIRPTTLDARVLQRDPPPEKAVLRRAPARAQSGIQLARAAAGPRNAPAAAKNSATSADDLSQLMSIITVIDTSELMILAKIPCRREPDGKLLCLVEHASLVEAIKISFNNPI
ncbi:hypothetical protein EVAR_78602_1 [Eumeta japonica]|uniref:Uncharacterized protein n=1 Tax=Eumeta variegata TaxID=151549 RepID=A0A4C1U959_EUMVA|nr:hypothetical protein EVAR_78602_1 [Eumeta japonica]